MSRQSRRDPLDHMSKRPDTSEGRFSALEARADIEDTLFSDKTRPSTRENTFSRPPTRASGKVVTIADMIDEEKSTK